MTAPPPHHAKPARSRAGTWIAWQLLGALALAAATLWLATDAAPQVTGNSAAAAGAGTHLQQWLRLNDPRRLQDGRVVVLRATPEELELLADQAAHLAGGAARTRLGVGRLDLQFSLPLAWPGVRAGARPPMRWLNLGLTLRDGQHVLQVVETIRVGHLRLPPPLAAVAVRMALAWWDRPPNGTQPWHTMIQQVRSQPALTMVALTWRADLPKRLANWALPPDRLATLRPYHDALRAVVQQHRPTPPLRALVAPLFRLAAQRSGTAGDAAAENRAALLVLAVYASGQPAARWWPQAGQWPPVPSRGARFGGRGDFAQHYLVSAALAAEGGGPLADALGAMKEVGDTRGGSGFSFTDIAVNRAGARLGELAVRDPRRVQALLATPPADGDLIPDVSDLPEFMSRREFQARFEGVGAPAYQAMLARIDARLDALAAYR